MRKTYKSLRRGQRSPRPLALRLRALRQWCGEHGLSQAQLAALSDVPGRVLRRYEGSRSLPPVVENFLSLALALQVPVERLVDPRRVDELRAGVERRQRRPPTRDRALTKPPGPLRSQRVALSVCYRAPHLALVVLRDGDVLYVQRHQLPRGRRQRSLARTLITELAADYDVDMFVVEPDAASDVGKLPTERLIQEFSLPEAKRTLLPSPIEQTHQDLYQHLVAIHPKLSRLVAPARRQGELKLDDRRRTVMLLGIALGLAAARTPLSRAVRPVHAS